MAWSEAAREASARVRRLHGEAKAKFHEYGTPKYDKYYTSKEHRAAAAKGLRLVRSRARAGKPFDWHSDKSAIDSAAYAHGMKHHWAAPKHATPASQKKVTSPYESKKFNKERKARLKKFADRASGGRYK